MIDAKARSGRDQGETKRAVRRKHELTCADCTTPRTMYSDRRRLRSQGSRWYARTCRWSTSSGSGWLWHQPSRRRILCTSGPRRTSESTAKEEGGAANVGMHLGVTRGFAGTFHLSLIKLLTRTLR